MKFSFLLELVMGLCASSYFLSTPLMQQYVYRRLWLQITNTSYPINDTSRCTANSSSNNSNSYEEVQRQASLFSLYTDVLSTVPSLVVILMLVTYSDRAGRKITLIMPLIGMLINTLAYLTVSYFELNIYLLVGSSILSALCGGLGTFLGGCFAYIADLCKTSHQKMLRMAVVDMIVGLLAGIASLLTGYFLKAAGFNWPFLTSSLLLCLSLLYAIFVLEETMKTPTDADLIDLSPQHSSVKQVLCGIYRMLAGASRSCKIALALLIIIFTSFTFAYIGGLSMITLYELNEPLCWTEILIGQAAALSSIVFLTSFGGVSILTYYGVPQLLIVLLGIMSLASGMVMVAFAKTTSLMIIAIALMLLSKMPFPVLRTMMSEIISKSEQGALFAFLHFLYVLTSAISTGVFNSIYAGTVAWCPGFVFLLSAGLCVLPLSVIGVVILMGVDFTKEAQKTTPYVFEEENPVAGPSQSSP